MLHLTTYSSIAAALQAILRNPKGLQHTIKMENNIEDYTDRLEDLEVIAKGSDNPLATLQGDGLYTVQLSNVREYIEKFSGVANERNHTLPPFLRPKGPPSTSHLRRRHCRAPDEQQAAVIYCCLAEDA